MADIGHPTPPLNFSDPIAGLRELAIVLHRVMRGGRNDAGNLTLDLSSTTTDVADLRVGSNSKIILTPTNANAATEVGSGGFYVSSKGDGTFTITHASNSNTRTFDYHVSG